MGRELKFIVPGNPVPQPAKDLKIIWPAGAKYMSFEQLKKRAFVSAYVPEHHSVNVYRNRIIQVARRFHRGPLMTGPVWMKLVLVFHRPQNMRWKRKPMPRYLHIKKKDRDNCVKAVQDALQGVVYKNDGQVCLGPIEKWVAAGEEQPHTEIYIRELDSLEIEDAEDSETVLPSVSKKAIF